MATMVWFELAAYTGGAKYVEVGERALAPLQSALAQAPTGFAWWLCALEFELAPPKEIALSFLSRWERGGGEGIARWRPRMCVNLACQIQVTEESVVSS